MVASRLAMIEIEEKLADTRKHNAEMRRKLVKAKKELTMRHIHLYLAKSDRDKVASKMQLEGSGA